MPCSLVTSTQALDELPRRRYLRVRLFYTDSTPADYEPPYFNPVDPAQSPYRFRTVQADEEPDFSTLGTVETGHHGVTLHTVSIANQLSTVFDNNVSAVECLRRNQRDASARSVVWDGQALVHAVTDEEGLSVRPEPLGAQDASGTLHTFEAISSKSELNALRVKVGLLDEGLALQEKVLRARGEAEVLDPNAFEDENEALRRAVSSHSPAWLLTSSS